MWKNSNKQEKKNKTSKVWCKKVKIRLWSYVLNN